MKIALAQPAPAAPKRGKKKTISKKPSMSGSSSDIQTIDRDKVLVNGIEIDIEKITDEQLYSLRKVLPRKDYRYESILVTLC